MIKVVFMGIGCSGVSMSTIELEFIMHYAEFFVAGSVASTLQGMILEM